MRLLVFEVMYEASVLGVELVVPVLWAKLLRHGSVALTLTTWSWRISNRGTRRDKTFPGDTQSKTDSRLCWGSGQHVRSVQSSRRSLLHEPSSPAQRSRLRCLRCLQCTAGSPVWQSRRLRLPVRAASGVFPGSRDRGEDRSLLVAQLYAKQRGQCKVPPIIKRQGPWDLQSERHDSACLDVTRTYLRDPAPPSDARPAATCEPSGPSQNRIGQRIGSYRITREIGHGGMGVVYEAVHDQLGQRAVIKTLKPELMLSQAYAQRFFTEARALSLAQHPSLVKLFDFGQLPDQTLYILMELLEGETLSSRLGRGPLDEAAVLRLTRQIASAVQVAHERSIVHRDLKPANIFIVSDPEASAGERVKILDFGLAKIVQGAGLSQGGPLQTITGMIMGTPVYMSPEQCRGLSAVDSKTDVYALGIMLFEMMAGRPPFVAHTADELIAMHIGQSPPPLRSKVPMASAAVAGLVADMLKKDAAARPTMAQVALRLVPETTTGRPSARATPRWVLNAAVGVAGVLAVGAVGQHFVRLRSRQTDSPAGSRSIAAPRTTRTPSAPAPSVSPAYLVSRPAPGSSATPPAARPAEGKVRGEKSRSRPVTASPKAPPLQLPSQRKPPGSPFVDPPASAPEPNPPPRVEPIPEDVDVPALR